jgi:hypothetical protein
VRDERVKDVHDFMENWCREDNDDLRVKDAWDVYREVRRARREDGWSVGADRDGWPSREAWDRACDVLTCDLEDFIGALMRAGEVDGGPAYPVVWEPGSSDAGWSGAVILGWKLRRAGTDVLRAEALVHTRDEDEEE